MAAATGAARRRRRARGDRRARTSPAASRRSAWRGSSSASSRLSPDELDRLAAAEPPPIAFLATIRRFVTPEAAAAFEAAEAAVAALVPPERWAEVGLREGLLGVSAELVLAPFLDDTLAEPFRGRARDRLLRAWEASIDQPRYGPNGAEVDAIRDRAAAMTAAEVAALLHASAGIPGDDRPWPAALDLDEDEALRISAILAGRDVAMALPELGLAPATATRARRLLGRAGHVAALRHAFSGRDLRLAHGAVRGRDGRGRRGGRERRARRRGAGRPPGSLRTGRPARRAPAARAGGAAPARAWRRSGRTRRRAPGTGRPPRAAGSSRPRSRAAPPSIQPASRRTLRWCDTVGWLTSQQDVKSQAQTSAQSLSWRRIARRVGSAAAWSRRTSGSV